MTESEDFEEKSAFDFKYGQEFGIVRTIVAFANTEGGKLRLSSFQCQASRLDSARLDDLINRFVVPRVGGISSSVLLNGSCEIIVRKSKQAPHVFSAYQSYVDERGRDRSAWQVGQVPVRHSSKTKEASADDFQRLIAERVQDVLAAIANSISRFGTKIGQEDNAIPVRLTTEIEALEIGMHDPNLIYPYNATQVAR